MRGHMAPGSADVSMYKRMEMTARGENGLRKQQRGEGEGLMEVGGGR